MKPLRTKLASLSLTLAMITLSACSTGLGHGTRVLGKESMHHGEQISSEQPLSASIDKISASSYLKVVVRYAETPRLKITAPDAKRQLTVREEAGGRLVILEDKREFKDKEGAFLVEVLTPTPLREVKISGVVVVSVSDARWHSEVTLGTSGASRLAVEKLSAQRALHIDCSGASRLKVDQIGAAHLQAEVSGAAKVELPALEVDHLSIDSSGASAITLAGKIKQAKIEASGASKVQATQAVALRADLSVSGAAKIAELSVSEEIHLSGSGAGKISYRGEPRVKALSTSGAASVKKI